MALFGKKRQPEVSNQADLAELEASVRNIRNRLADRKMDLGDLFAMMNEDERPILAHLPNPHQPPADQPLPGEFA